MQLVFAPDVVSCKQSKGVSGRYGAEDALTQLLVGTGLTWERVNGQTIAIKRAYAPAAEPRAKAPSAPAAAQSDEPKAQDLRSEEHTSELQSLMRISYAVFCLKKKKYKHNKSHILRQNTN